MSIVLFILCALALTMAVTSAVCVANWLMAKKDGKKFVGLSAALSDGVAKKAFSGLIASLFVISCFVILALSAAHIISI